MTPNRPVERERLLSEICKLRYISCFEILPGSIFTIDLVGETHFWAKTRLKAPMLPKIHTPLIVGGRKLVGTSKRPQSLLYDRCSEISILLRQPEVP